MLVNVLAFYGVSQSLESEQIKGKKQEDSSLIPDQCKDKLNSDNGILNNKPILLERTTRSTNPYLSRNIYPINAWDSDGGNPGYQNLDEAAPGDGNEESSGKDNSYAWIECDYDSSNIVAGSIINSMTIFIGYRCDADWDISSGHKGMVWIPIEGGSEHNISDYPVTTTKRDEIFTITSDLPTINELNNGIKIRISGYDTDGAGPDYLYLDYLYFTLDYSIPDIVINEIMFNATAGDEYSEWVEIYNAGEMEIDLNGWNLTDNDGNIFSLTDAGIIPAGGYLVCHLAQSGTSNSSDIFGAITTNIIIQPNATEGIDTYFDFNNPSTNYGSDPYIRVENSTSVFRSVIQFNITEISEIGLSVSRLHLFHYDGHPSGNATINVQRLNRSWTETGSNWNTYEGINNWTSAGGDYNLTIENTSLVIAGSYGWSSWDVTDSIRGWKNGTYENYGLILLGEVGSSWHLFYSSDYLGDPSLRPKLTVNYNNTNKMLEDNDDLAIIDHFGNIVDYVAWGEDPGMDDDLAVLTNQWIDGEYIDTSFLTEGQTLARDREGNDSDQKEDWQNATGYADDFGVDRNEIWGPSPGERNADPDLIGPRIRNIFANPESQILDGYVNITCNVTDPDGVSNVWINISLPSGVNINTSMVQNLGLPWYYNDNYSTLGYYQYIIWANDTVGNWSVSSSRQFEIANRAPYLSYGQVNPTSGYYTSGFNFSVIYTDLDNHAPNIITLNITNLGIYSLIQLDSADNVYSDGKSYYINISTLPAGVSHTFHFAAQDIIGLWSDESIEIDAPDILSKPATLTAFDESIKYSDDAHLTALLMDGPIPLEGEDIAFYIDMNDNGIYETAEKVGEGTTLSDGSVSVIYKTYLDIGSFHFASVYVGSSNYSVNNGQATLTINAKHATLTAQSEVAEEGETTTLSAMLIDEDGHLGAGEQVAFYLDKNRNDLYEGSELLGLALTSINGIASLDYSVVLVPQQYKIWAKYSGSANYDVSEIEGMLTVQNTGNHPPSITGYVPHQIMPEDSSPWTLTLTPYESDNEDHGSDLNWYITGVNTALYSVTGLNSSNDLFTFIPVENAYGNDETILWLVDSSGAVASQKLWINITPVNDVPYFDPVPPNLNIHYDDPTTPSDNPDPWDYMFYVHDVETPVENLIITTSEPTLDYGNGYAEVDDLKITFHYPQKRVGETIVVTLTLTDGTDSVQTVISITITTNWAPELIKPLPDIVIEENSNIYNVFDLNDFFTDRDIENLLFSSDFLNINVKINANNTVDISALGQWTGNELVTFRAKDPTGAIAEGYCTVTVIPINDAPVISQVPDLMVHFDYLYTFDLTPYVSDGDNLTSELVVWTSESQDNIWVQQNNNLGLVINYPESTNGTSFPVIIYVSDGIESSYQQIQVTVTNDYSPELVSEIPDVSFDEDTVLESYFLLSDFFFDPDGDTLTFTTNGEFIIVLINDNLTVDFSAPENWYGSEIITFRATDTIGGLIEDRVTVVVVPVNDPPTLLGVPDQKKDEGDHWVLDLSNYIIDVDNNVSKLIIRANSEAGQEYVQLVGTILIFQYPKGVYEDIITVTIDDGQHITSWRFNVSLSKSESIGSRIQDGAVLPWLVIALLISSIVAVVIYRKKSRYYVYEAYLIHETGPALAYASREKNMDLEDVIVSGMFTAVQDFINDTLKGRTFDEWKLDEMKFSKGKILIEKTQNLYIAAIFDGDGNKLRKHVKKLLQDINEKYGELLADWDGNMSKLEGIKAMTMSLINKKGTVSEEQSDRLDAENEELLEGEKEEELEEYVCPVCETEISIKDTKCPGCNVEFEKPEDSLDSSEQVLGSDELEDGTDYN